MVRPQRGTRVAMLSGSLGKSNVGDEALADSFVRRHERDYQKLLFLTETPGNRPGVAREMPRLAIGRRKWTGWQDRRTATRWVREACHEAPLDYVWVGGLLGERLHVKARGMELVWASSVAERFVYYFGDAERSIREYRSEARTVIQGLSRFESWIGVRSHEAAEVLADIGVRQPIYVGVDPVLFDRVEAGLPPIRDRPSTLSSVALCSAGWGGGVSYRQLWLDAARTAAEQGMRIDWLAFESPVDCPICEAFANETAEAFPECQQRVITGADVIAEIERADVAVTGRYHGLIYAATAHVPTIVIAWNDKLDRLARLLLGAAWIITPNERRGAIDGLLRSQEVLKWTLNERALTARLAEHSTSLAAFAEFLR